MSTQVSALQAQEEGYIVGVKTGKIEPRLEIDEFVQDRDVLNLFLLALIQLQDEKRYKEPWSWFQICGIHGRPFSDWDDVRGKHVNLRGQNIPVQAGYCSHSSVTFPTWHRPYVAMMEQAIYVAMLGIAKQYQDQQRYLNACSRFRHPYWDPCLPRETGTAYNFGIPQIVSVRQVYIRFPANPEILSPVDNPLFSYKFPGDVQDFDDQAFRWNQMGNALIRAGGNTHTVRAPDGGAKTKDVDIDRYISDHIQADVGSSLYKVLTVNQDWSTFSNDGAPAEVFQQRDKDGNRESIEIFHTVEGFHDNIHGHIGQGALRNGSGHMGDPQLAAFDPIFWLHHCNIDRITAIWQTRNPNSWWREQAMARSNMNWAVPEGHIERPSDYLIPFRKSKKTENLQTFWTSNDIRNWQNLGYTYLGKRINRGNSGQNELASFPIDLYKTDPQDIKVSCTQFYGWMDNKGMDDMAPIPDLIYQFYPINLSNVEALTGKAASDRPPLPKPHRSRTPNDPIPNPLYPDYSHLKGLMYNGCLRQWNAYISVEKFAFFGSFQVFIFIGDFSQNPDEWSKDPNLAGIDIIFASDPKSGGCDNCERQAESSLLVTDVIPLTAHLIKWIRNGEEIPHGDPMALACRSLESSDVMPFLYKNLHWRVATPKNSWAGHRPDPPPLLAQQGQTIYTLLALSTQLRELVILYSSLRFSSTHEHSQHVAISQPFVTDAQRAEIGVAGADASLFARQSATNQGGNDVISPQELAMLRFLEAVVNKPRVDDEVFEQARKVLTERQIVVLVVVQRYYYELPRITTVFKVDPDKMPSQGASLHEEADGE